MDTLAVEIGFIGREFNLQDLAQKIKLIEKDY
jgi:hypothetical protein